MSDLKSYYVYHHINRDSGEIFYVGKGIGNRCYDKNRSKFWKRYVRKYGDYDVAIVRDNLTEDEAYEFEFYEIERIGRRITKRGSLVNILPGGRNFPDDYIKYKEDLENELGDEFDIPEDKGNKIRLMLMIDKFMKSHRVEKSILPSIIDLDEYDRWSKSNLDEKKNIILQEHNKTISNLKERKEFKSLKLINNIDELSDDFINKMISLKEKQYSIWKKVLE